MRRRHLAIFCAVAVAAGALFFVQPSDAVKIGQGCEAYEYTLAKRGGALRASVIVECRRPRNVAVCIDRHYGDGRWAHMSCAQLGARILYTEASVAVPCSPKAPMALYGLRVNGAPLAGGYYRCVR